MATNRYRRAWLAWPVALLLPAVTRAAEMPAAGWLDAARWNPYAVGIGIGVLSWLAFLLSDHPLGVSSAYARSAGMLEKAARGEHVEQRPYWQEYKPKIDWVWMLLLGLFLGAAISALLSGDFRWEVVPPTWRAAFGQTPVSRLIVALFGGWCLGLGARWADGCTSGHGISGTLQLVASSWVAVICFFIGGVASAMLIFHVLA